MGRKVSPILPCYLVRSRSPSIAFQYLTPRHLKLSLFRFWYIVDLGALPLNVGMLRDLEISSCGSILFIALDSQWVLPVLNFNVWIEGIFLGNFLPLNLPYYFPQVL